MTLPQISTLTTNFHSIVCASSFTVPHQHNMETSTLLSLVDNLDDTIDDLEESLEPLLAATALSATTKKLPVLDKAKLYVLVVYAVESLLFCTFSSSGGNFGWSMDYGRIADAPTSVSEIEWSCSKVPPGVSGTHAREAVL